MPYKSDEGQPCRELVAYQSLLPDFYASFSPRYPCDARTKGYPFAVVPAAGCRGSLQPMGEDGPRANAKTEKKGPS